MAVRFLNYRDPCGSAVVPLRGRGQGHEDWLRKSRRRTDLPETCVSEAPNYFVVRLGKVSLSRVCHPRSLPVSAMASLHDSLMARLDRLASVRLVAQIGAAIGR